MSNAFPNAPPMLPTEALTQLWVGVLRRPWSSLVLVPAQPGASTLPVARALADAGVRSGHGPLGVMSTENVDVDMVVQQLVRTREQGGLSAAAVGGYGPSVSAQGVDAARAGRVITPAPDAGGQTSMVLQCADGSSAVLGRPSPARLIVAIDSVLSRPAGVAVALAADFALLCVHMRMTSMAAARRTIEIVGRDRMLGCITLLQG